MNENTITADLLLELLHRAAVAGKDRVGALLPDHTWVKITQEFRKDRIGFSNDEATSILGGGPDGMFKMGGFEVWALSPDAGHMGYLIAPLPAIHTLRRASFDFHWNVDLRYDDIASKEPFQFTSEVPNYLKMAGGVEGALVATYGQRIAMELQHTRVELASLRRDVEELKRKLP